MNRARLCVVVMCCVALAAPGCDRRAYERADLEKKVLGLSESQLRRAMGDPDGYAQGSGGRADYTYKDVVKKAGTSGKEDAIIVVENGRVAWVGYPADPPIDMGKPEGMGGFKLR